jgi:hypothetical protein
MRIEPIGNMRNEYGIDTSFVTKMAIDMINSESQSELTAEDFSPTKTDKHTISLSRLAYDGDLPEGVTSQFWTDSVVARRLQKF